MNWFQILFFSLILFLSSCEEKKLKELSPISTKHQKRIKISFSIDDSLINQDNQYTIFISNGSDTLQTSIIYDNEIKLPAINHDSGYAIIFKYKQYEIAFDGLTRRMIIPQQDIEWRFGIDNRPFSRMSGLISPVEEKDTTIKQIFYFKLDPMEEGDGIQFIKKIRN